MTHPDAAPLPTPDHILQVGTGFMPAKVLLVAVRMGLFTVLAEGPASGEMLGERLGLHARSRYDFLDALVALGFLEREGLKGDATYRNAAESDLFLDRGKPSYVGGILEMANDRLYPFWSDLDEGLRTGEPQNEVKHEGVDLFDKLYDEPDRLRQFMNAMVGVQMGAFVAFAEQFDFSRYKSFCDVGGASGALSVEVARRHPHMHCRTLDLPKVEPIANERIQAAGLEDRVTAGSVDFFARELPGADVITMGNILHDWGLDEKKLLIRKAYNALTDGGALVVIENIIDDDRRQNVFGLLMSLNMLIETRAGFDFSGADFEEWARKAGFREVNVMPLAGSTSAAIAYK